jgi:hypothetical protein
MAIHCNRGQQRGNLLRVIVPEIAGLLQRVCEFWFRARISHVKAEEANDFIQPTVDYCSIPCDLA